jgi:hypothetical protein
LDIFKYSLECCGAMPPLALKLPQIIVKEKPIKLQDDPIENSAAFSDVDPIPHQKLFSNS